MYADRLLPNAIIGNLQMNQQQAYVGVKDLIYKSQYLKSDGLVKEVKELFVTLKDDNRALIESYRGTTLTTDEKDLIDDFVEADEAYDIGLQEVVKRVERKDYIGAIREHQKIEQYILKTHEDLASLKELNMIIAAELKEKSDAYVQKGKTIAMVLTGMCILLSIIIGIIVQRSIVTGLKEGVNHAGILAQGNFVHNIEERYLQRKDEIGQLACAFQDMTIKLKNLILSAHNNCKDIGEKSEELNDLIQEMNAQVQMVNTSTEEIASGMEETSAAVEEISASGHQIMDYAKILTTKAIEGSKNI